MSQTQVEKMPSLRLRARDGEILKFLLQRHFAAPDQIKREFWPEKKARCNHYRRLGALVKMGFVQKLIGDHGGSLGYALAPRGIAFLRSKGVQVEDIQAKRVLYRSTFSHDKALNDVRGILEKSPIISEFNSEKQVRTLLAKRHGIQAERDEKYKVPDGLFRLQTKGKSFVVAIELEMTLKSRVRYLKIFQQLSLSSDFQIIFMIGKTESLKQKLVGLLQEVRETDPWVKAHPVRPGFYFTTLPEVLESGLHAKFQGEGSELTIASLASEFRGDLKK